VLVLVLLVAVAGSLLTLSIYYLDTTAATCNYTACDPGWAMSVLIGTAITIGVILVAGITWTVRGIRQRRSVVRALVTLLVLGCVCVLSWYVYGGSGSVNF
jgi:hypothetical protein